MSRIYNQAVATISSGQSLSAAVAVGAGVVTALIMPSAWTAADISFQGSIDGVSFYDLYDAYDGEVTAKVAANRYVSIEGINFAGLTFLKMRSGPGAAAVNQGADRAITVVARKERAKQ